MPRRREEVKCLCIRLPWALTTTSQGDTKNPVEILTSRKTRSLFEQLCISEPCDGQITTRKMPISPKGNWVLKTSKRILKGSSRTVSLALKVFFTALRSRNGWHRHTGCNTLLLVRQTKVQQATGPRQPSANKRTSCAPRNTADGPTSKGRGSTERMLGKPRPPGVIPEVSASALSFPFTPQQLLSNGSGWRNKLASQHPLLPTLETLGFPRLLSQATQSPWMSSSAPVACSPSLDDLQMDVSCSDQSLRAVGPTAFPTGPLNCPTEASHAPTARPPRTSSRSLPQTETHRDPPKPPSPTSTLSLASAKSNQASSPVQAPLGSLPNLPPPSVPTAISGPAVLSGAVCSTRSICLGLSGDGSGCHSWKGGATGL